MHQISNQKQILLSSMQKLIKYIQFSQGNQWEIFESLSKKDISKIINNLEDQDSKIRKLSLTMLGSLLNNNNSLRLRFCQRMEIAQIPGKICLNLSSLSKIPFNHEKIFLLVNLLKEQVKKQDQIFPIWIISLRNQKAKVDFIPLSTLSYIDPNDHLVGFNLLEQNAQNPKKTFLSLFGLSNQTSRNQIKKPLFKVTPMTERSSSHSTEYSNRFNRTSHNKTSLKQPLKKSLIVQRSQNNQNSINIEKQKEIKSTLKYQSEKASPKKFKRTQERSINQFSTFESYWNHPKNSSQVKENKKVAPSVINNTNIYINGPVSQILVVNSKIQIKKLLEQRKLRQKSNKFQQFSSKDNKKDENYVSQRHINNEYFFTSGQNECNIFIRPISKYERKTVKQDSIKAKQFDYNEYKQFLKTVNGSSKKKNVPQNDNIYNKKISQFMAK